MSIELNIVLYRLSGIETEFFSILSSFFNLFYTDLVELKQIFLKYIRINFLKFYTDLVELKPYWEADDNSAQYEFYTDLVELKLELFLKNLKSNPSFIPT